MKKILFSLGICLTMIACGGNQTVSSEAVNDSNAVDSLDSTLVDSTLIDTICVD